MSLVKNNNPIFPALMNEIFQPDWFGGLEKVSSKLPPVNIKENETNFELQLCVPGGKKEDFKIEIENDELIVSSEAKDTHNDEGEYTRREFAFNAFNRVFTLPNTVNAEGIEANYKDGILSFVLPKKEEALPKPKKVIEIS